VVKKINKYYINIYMNNYIKQKKYYINLNKNKLISKVEITNPEINLSKVPVKITNPEINLSKVPVKITNSEIKISKVPVEITNSEIKISKVPVEITNPEINLSNVPVEILNSNFKLPEVNRSDIIPKVIYQTWYSKNLSKSMSEAVKKLKSNNPLFKHYLYDDNDCRNFIEKNFPKEVLYSYDCLIPGAYKADLWRYCILYLYGGIYLDIKYEPINNFSFNFLIKNENICKDRPSYFKNRNGYYNALMIMKPGNIYLEYAIKKIYLNCKNKNYGYNNLYPTGPGLLSEIFPANFSKNNFNFIGYDIIKLNNVKILKSYPQYRNEQRLLKSKYYQDAWNDKQIYKS